MAISINIGRRLGKFNTYSWFKKKKHCDQEEMYLICSWYEEQTGTIAFTTAIQHYTWGPSKQNKVRKEKAHRHIGNKDTKIIFFTNNVISNTENPKESTKKSYKN